VSACPTAASARRSGAISIIVLRQRHESIELAFAFENGFDGNRVSTANAVEQIKEWNNNPPSPHSADNECGIFV